MNGEDPKSESEIPADPEPKKKATVTKCTSCKSSILEEFHFCPYCGMVTGR